jgi:hypothetical protein
MLATPQHGGAAFGGDGTQVPDHTWGGALLGSGDCHARRLRRADGLTSPRVMQTVDGRYVNRLRNSTNAVQSIHFWDEWYNWPSPARVSQQIDRRRHSRPYGARGRSTRGRAPFPLPAPRRAALRRPGADTMVAAARDWAVAAAAAFAITPPPSSGCGMIAQGTVAA